MTNFIGIGQFFARILNIDIANMAQNRTSNALPENWFVPVPTANNNINNLPQMLMPQDIEQNKLDLQYLDTPDVSKYVQDALQVPKELTQLLDNMKTNSDLISMDKLRTLLQEQGKNGVSTVIKMLSEMSRQDMYKPEQLREIMKIIGNIIPTNDTPAAQILKNIILLYLPWLPLGENVDYQLRFGSSSAKSEDSDEISTITITIETVNFGLIKVMLALDPHDKTRVLMKISCPEEFPKDALQHKIKEDAASNNMHAAIKYETVQSQSSIKKAEQPRTEQPKADIHASGEISPYLVLAAQMVIRQVISIDKKEGLRHHRKSMLG